MPQAIDIITLDGKRFDLSPDTNIELNMGGISLLNLQSRTASYTNNFNIPKTPNNDLLFEFARSYNRSNKPSIKVIISKGLFQKKALLKLLSVDNNYQCSVNYDPDNIIEKMKNQGMDVYDSYCNNLFLDTSVLNPTEFLQTIFNYADYMGINSPDGWYLFPLQTNVDNCDRGVFNLFNSLSEFLYTAFDKIGIAVDLTDDLFTNADFNQCAIQNNQYYLFFEGVDYGSGNMTIQVDMKKIGSSFDVKNVSLSDIVKSVCQIFGVDFVIENSSVKFTSIYHLLSNDPVSVDGFDSSKELSTGLAKNNTITYTAKDSEKELYGSDVIVADGTGDKELFKCSSIIPKTDSIGYISNLENTNGSVFIVKVTKVTTPKNKTLNVNGFLGVDDFSYTDSSQYSRADILSFAGFYSTPLNPIFANTFIAKADKVIDIFTADKIMKARKIRSVELGGDYFVEEMQHSLTTGQSKMKLIKLP